MDMGLQDRTAVVLAATGGLGRAVATTLSDEGARVAVVGRNKSQVYDVALSLPNSLPIIADLALPTAASTIHRKITDNYGGADILILNGGGPEPGEAMAVSPATLQDIVGQLLQTQITLTNLSLAHMLENNWGRVVAIGSSGVEQPIANLAASNIGRAALRAYLKTLASEVAPQGVTVNMVLPGRILTERVRSLDIAAAKRRGIDIRDVRSESERAIPIGRYGQPEELAALVSFLASESAGYITGESIRCDGGLVRSF